METGIEINRLTHPVPALAACRGGHFEDHNAKANPAYAALKPRHSFIVGGFENPLVLASQCDSITPALIVTGRSGLQLPTSW